MTDNVKIVPASCTQCGGTVEVDPQTQSAVCPFCGSTFIVEKAVNNYNVQHATIEHADNVNIDMTGSVKTVLDFVGDQMKESRAERRIARQEAEKTQRMINRGFLKIFGIMCIGMLVIALVSVVIMLLTGVDSDSEFYEYTYSEDDTVSCYIDQSGMLSVNITDPGLSEWLYESNYSTENLRSQESDFDGFHFTIKPAHDSGVGYAVVGEYDEDGSISPVSYGIAEFTVESGSVTKITDVAHVTDLSEYDFRY